ncbi:CHC2 zinc finger domain-containing protein [uncultured Sphingomonas sp.]|uniref:CHC2 zinc finger domain-containing protein n=1 Tax=Sphingomonas sp. SORGH_AS_0950 TaxID=3041792 RepID=UPI00345C5B2B
MSDPSAFRSTASVAHHLAKVVAKTVELETTQSGLRGSCPFHPDATRGLYVHNGRFHCFSCGAGGDVVDWWMRLHRADEETAAAYLTRGASGDGADHDKKPC